MRVLVYCLYKRLYQAAIDSIHALRWHRPLDLMFVYGPPMEKRGAAIAAGQRQMRDIFLAGDWNALLTVESDMIVPPDALEKLAQVEADVAYGLYCSRWRYNWMACANTVRGQPKTPISNRPWQIAESWGKQIEVTGKGWGCTLIGRHVMKEYEPRSGAGHFSDHWLSTHCIDRGWRQVCDTTVRCGHIVHKDYEDAESAVWPIGKPPYYEIRSL